MLDAALSKVHLRTSWLTSRSPRFCCNAIDDDVRVATVAIWVLLRDAVEHASDEGRLAPDISSVDVSNLPLSDHRHSLETRQRSPRRSEAAEAEARASQALDAPVVLLNDIVEVFALSQTGAAPEFAISFHVRNGPWIGGILIDRERARVHVVRLRDCLAEEPLRRGCIAPRRQKEIDRLP